MMTQERFEELSDLYLQDKLSGQDLLDWEYALAQHPEWEESFNTKVWLVKIIEADRKAELKAFIREHATIPQRGISWPNVIFFSSAAILTVSIGLFFLMEYYHADLPLPKQIGLGGVTISPKTGGNTTISRNKNELKEYREIDVANEPGVPDSISKEKDLFSDQPTSTVPSTTYNEQNGLTQTESMSDAKDDITIIDDRLMLDTVYLIQPLAYTVFDEEKSEGYRTATSPPSAPPEVKTKSLERKKQVDDKAPQKDSEVESPKQETLNVEFWQSPIHYKGYKYNGRKLILYGVAVGSKPTLAQYETGLLMFWNGKYYQLQRNEVFNAFEPLSEKELRKLKLGE